MEWQQVRVIDALFRPIPPSTVIAIIDSTGRTKIPADGLIITEQRNRASERRVFCGTVLFANIYQRNREQTGSC
jgi:hypothetical protein